MYTISISHKTSPLEIRRAFAFTALERENFIKSALDGGYADGCVLLSTCNRLEIYFTGGVSVRGMEELLCRFKNADINGAIKYFNIFSGDQAVRHLFKVACGIDSMVMGEDEILGQVKDAFAASLEISATSYALNTVFRNAVAAAKKIKTCTGISKTPVSIGTLTANAVFGINKPVKNVLIIGISGKMGTIAAKNLLSKENINIVGTIRRHNASLPETYFKRLKYVDYDSRFLYMDNSDVIISATSSPHYTVTADEYLKNTSAGKTRLLIDLAVPNDIDPSLAEAEGVTLYNIDYFETLSKGKNILKRREAETAEEMLETLADETIKELAFHEFLPQIPKIKEYINKTKIENIFYKMRKELTAEEMRAVIRAFEKITKG